MRSITLVELVREFERWRENLSSTGYCTPEALWEYAGHVFIFRNKRANAIKILTYDGQGFWLCLSR